MALLPSALRMAKNSPNLIMKLSTEGGSPTRLSETSGSFAVLSPDGKLVAYVSREEQQSVASVRIISSASGASVSSFPLTQFCKPSYPMDA